MYGLKTDESRNWIKSKKNKEIHEDEGVPPPPTLSAPSALMPSPSPLPDFPSHLGEFFHPANDILVHGLAKVKVDLSNFREEVRGELCDIYRRQDEITHLLEVILSHLLPFAPSISPPSPSDS